jgi:ABC-type nitrate/sulfonate/bicarbonate transport system ATPase subunit
MSAPDIARMGIGYVPQGRGLFAGMTVSENLSLGRLARSTDGQDGVVWNEETILQYFPRLRARMDVAADYLSGGEQQMVAVARALSGNVKLLLLDEPSGALDEITRNQLNDTLVNLHQTLNFTALHVTHSVHEAAYLADRVFILGGQPARIIKELRNPLPRPRRAEMRDSLDYHHFTVECARALRLS